MTTLTIGIHPPHDPTVELLNNRLAVANFGEAMFFARTPAEADALILAGVALKDLLLAVPLVPCPDPAPHEPHDRCPGVAAPALAGEVSADTAGIPVNQFDNAGHATLATSPCGPGACTCGAHVDAAGHVTPAGAA